MQVSVKSVAVRDPDAVLYRRIALRLLPFLMLCYACAYLDRVNVGFAKLGMAQELRFSEAIYGAGAGIFFIGYFLFEVPSNAILHRVGARTWIARIMISWAVLSAACALVQGQVSFYVARFLLGAAEAGFFPGVILYLTYWFPAARRGQIIALFMVAIPLSGLFGAPLSGAIMEALDGVGGHSGWRWMLGMEALPALLLGLSVPFVLSSRPADARWLSDADKALLETNLAADLPNAGTTGGEEERRIRDVLVDPVVLRFALIYFCCIMGQYGVTFWLPALVRAAGAQSTWLVGAYSAIPYGAAVVTMVLTGRYSDRTGERRGPVAICSLAGAAGLILTSLAGTHLGLALLGLSLAAAGLLTTAPVFWTLPTALLRGSAAAVGIAAINSVGNLGGFVSPMLVGWLNDRTGFSMAGLWALAMISAIGAVAVLRTKA